MLRSTWPLVLATASLMMPHPAFSGTMLKAWPHTDAPASRIREPGLPQFGRLNEYVWRSGQPSRTGYQRLVQMGLKTVVNLRSECPKDEVSCPKGVRYVCIPMRDRRPPTDMQVHELLHIVADPKNWPVLIHCHSGESRAGLMCAAIRYSLDGWDDHRIMQELRNFQLQYLGIAKIPLTHRERHWMRQWELKNQPGAFTL